MSDPKKLVYRQQALKEGSAKDVVANNLSCHGDHYYVDYLRQRYDRPRLVHHISHSNDHWNPIPQEETGRKLRRLHGKAPLKALEKEPSHPFINYVLDPRRKLHQCSAQVGAL